MRGHDTFSTSPERSGIISPKSFQYLAGKLFEFIHGTHTQSKGITSYLIIRGNGMSDKFGSF